MRLRTLKRWFLFLLAVTIIDESCSHLSSYLSLSFQWTNNIYFGDGILWSCVYDAIDNAWPKKEQQDAA